MARKLNNKLSWIYKEYNKILKRKKNISEDEKSRIFTLLHKKADKKFKKEELFS